MIKRRWSSKIRYYHQSSYRRSSDFANLFHRFKRTMSVLGRSESTVETTVSMLPLWRFILKSPNWARCRTSARILISTSKSSKTPSQTYFKHCVYGLRFLLKSEGLPYEYLHLPSIKHDKKLPTVLSKEEVWRLLQHCQLLKHKILIGLLYGCGLRCMEVRSVRLQDLDFDREQLKVVQGKVKKRPLRSLIKTFNSRTQNLHWSRKAKTYLFNGQPKA
jgi:integrase